MRNTLEWSFCQLITVADLGNLEQQHAVCRACILNEGHSFQCLVADYWCIVSRLDYKFPVHHFLHAGAQDLEPACR